MEQKLLRILSDTLGVPVDTLDSNTSSAQIAKWDSLSHMNVIFAVEDAFNVIFADDKLADSTSVKALMAVIEQGQ